jgi:hypothetical protein
VAGAQEGAFNEVVKWVDMIEHTASLFHLNADDPDGASQSQFTIRIYLHIRAHYYLVLELIFSDVTETFGILQNALKYGCTYLADKF